jgi:hypothetical protein
MSALSDVLLVLQGDGVLGLNSIPDVRPYDGLPQVAAEIVRQL